MNARTLSIALLGAFALLGCEKPQEETNSTTPPATPEDQVKKEEPPVVDETPRKLVGPALKDGEEVAVMETSSGRIVIRFLTDKAPKTVENFKKLAKIGFYDGTRFHRTIPGFMIQGGDPNSKDKEPMTWGTGGPGYTIKDELNDIKHDVGILSMAHAGPNTGGSQFFVMVGKAPHLDMVHTAFGEVVTGMSVVDKIVNTPTSGGNGQVDPAQAAVIKSVKIEKWPVK